MATNTMGFECELYRGPAGSKATTLMTNVKDVNIPAEAEEVDTTTRASGGYDTSAVGSIKVSLDFEMATDMTDADYIALRDAFYNKTVLAFFPSDGNDHGLDADWNVIKFTDNQPLKGVCTTSVSIRLARSSRAPTLL